MQQEEPNKYVKELTQEKYKYGFTTEVHTDVIERGLNEDVVRLISSFFDEIRRTTSSLSPSDFIEKR